MIWNISSRNRYIFINSSLTFNQCHKEKQSNSFTSHLFAVLCISNRIKCFQLNRATSMSLFQCIFATFVTNVGQLWVQAPDNEGIFWCFWLKLIFQTEWLTGSRIDFDVALTWLIAFTNREKSSSKGYGLSSCLGFRFSTAGVTTRSSRIWVKITLNKWIDWIWFELF